MQNKRLSAIECDSCFIVNDSESLGAIAIDTSLSPANRMALACFWLCPECKPEFPNGAKDFFTAEFFETDPYCERCEMEPVENWGHVCDYCEDGVI